MQGTLIRSLLSILGVGALLLACGGNDSGDEFGDVTDDVGSSESNGSSESTGDGEANTGDDADTTGGDDPDTTDDIGTDTTSDGNDDGCGAGEMLCNGSCTDVMSDDLNCGSCGNVCKITGQAGQYGGCSNGSCEPTLSECVLTEDPPKSCDEVCSGRGTTCADQGCNGVTFTWYGAQNLCEQFLGGDNGPDGCINPTVNAGSFYRCCCEQ